MTAVRVGTRRSALAVRQTEMVADALRGRLERPVELVEITTRGDVDPGPLASIGGTGVFVSALRDALRRGEVDLAVHSLKDLPTAPAPGLVLAAVPSREDPRDAVVADGRLLADLPAGSRIGTGSPRRAAALRAMGRGYLPVPVRGNVDTRVRMVADATVDAVVLAMAGLSRLGRRDVAARPIDVSDMPPAPGQGALAVESREDCADDLAAAVSAVDDPATRACVIAERTLLASLQAGCSAPVGALAEASGGSLRLRARVWSVDGAGLVSGERHGAADDPARLGRALADELLARGAVSLLENTLLKDEERAQ